MPAESGGNGSRVTGTPTRVDTTPRTASGRYRQLGRDELLNDILYETADAAAAEEAALSSSLEERQRSEEARRQAEEEARRRLAAASLEEEQRRRREGSEVRQRVGQQIEEEQLRLRGLWSRFEEKPRAEAPDTDQLARLTDAQILAARASSSRDAYRPTELAASRPRRLPVPVPALGLAVLLCGGGLAWAVSTSGDLVDDAIYVRTTVAVTATVSPSIAVETRAAAADDRQRRAATRERSRERGRAATQAAFGRDEAGDDEAASQGPRRGRTPLDISLENASELWRVGSE
jgi:hypothetical protein